MRCWRRRSLKTTLRYIKTSQCGFLLMEVLAAVAIITVLLAMTGLMMQARHLTTKAADIVTASSLAQQQLESLKGKSSAFWQLYSTSDNIDWQGPGNQPITLNGRCYVVTTTVNIGVGSSNLSKVTVRVSWQDGRIIHAVVVMLLYDITIQHEGSQS